MVVVERFGDVGGAEALRADARVIEECESPVVHAVGSVNVTGARWVLGET